MRITRLSKRNALLFMATIAALPSYSTINFEDLSDAELSQLVNQDEGTLFVYCDRKRSKMAEVIEQLSNFDQDLDSPLWQLMQHIQKGSLFVERSAIINALQHAETVLQNINVVNEEIEQINADLNTVIDAVIDGELNVDTESLLEGQTKGCRPDHHDSQRSKIKKIREKLYVLETAKFFKDVEFKNDVCFEDDVSFKERVTFDDNVKFRQDVDFQDDVRFEDKVEFEAKVKFEENVKFEEGVIFEEDVTFQGGATIEGTLSVADEVVGCDLTVGCNISMNDSISPSIGNIIKGGVPFIHNFGTDNTFVGKNSGNFTTTGGDNAAFGINTLSSNTSGTFNVAVGSGSLFSNTTGNANVASGQGTLELNTTGSLNTAMGHRALASNVTGSGNTALGHNALMFHLVDNTVAVGVNALGLNTIGTSNTAVGYFSMVANITGSNNTALGQFTLVNLISGNNNIAIGSGAGDVVTTGSNNIYINADAAAANESDTTRIGTSQTRAFIAGIRGAVTGIADAIPVLIDSAGQLGTISSSREFKHNIQNMGDTSSAILNLRPVTFAYNHDVTEKMQFGLIAEEVEEIFPRLVIHNSDGTPYTVDYLMLPTMLLNELKKQQVKVNELATKVALLEERA